MPRISFGGPFAAGYPACHPFAARHSLVAVLAALSLALGIGANTAILSLVDRLVLRSLPVRDPARPRFADDERATQLHTELQLRGVRCSLRSYRLFEGVLAVGSCCGHPRAPERSAEFVDRLFVSGS